MQFIMHIDLVLIALLAVFWRHQPKQTVIIIQSTGYDWERFVAEHNLYLSIRRRGDFWDNDVAESFFQLLKRE